MIAAIHLKLMYLMYFFSFLDALDQTLYICSVMYKLYYYDNLFNFITMLLQHCSCDKSGILL